MRGIFKNILDTLLGLEGLAHTPNLKKKETQVHLGLQSQAYAHGFLFYSR